MSSSVRDQGGYVYLCSSKSAVLDYSTRDMTADQSFPGKPVKPSNRTLSKDIEFMPRGPLDDMPLQVILNAGKNVTTATNLDFKTNIAYGEGIQVLRKYRDEHGKICVDEVLRSEQPAVFDWLEDTDYASVAMELINDLRLFGDAFIEYDLDRADKPSVAQVRALESSFSRISKITNDGHIEWHGYCADWQRDYATKTIVTPLLDRLYPRRDLLQRCGRRPGPDGRTKVSKERRFVQMLTVPCSGRFYYSHPYWWSVFASGWFDYSNDIITFKKSLLQKEMVVKHVVYILDSFYERLYSEHSCVSAEDRAKTKHEFLESLDQFLAGAENAGTSIVSNFEYDRMKGIEMKEIIIDEIDKSSKGGDYLEDSEESSNVLCYGMGVHSSILGNSPGKNKTINGTEARELFLIQQSLSKYVQQLVCRPLYVVKAVNGWPADLEFAVANLQLTTLDANSGAVKTKGIRPQTQE